MKFVCRDLRESGAAAAIDGKHDAKEEYDIELRVLVRVLS